MAGAAVHQALPAGRRRRLGVQGTRPLELPEGRVQATPGTRFIIGTKFMNVDIARLLDDEYSRLRSSRSHTIASKSD